MSANSAQRALSDEAYLVDADSAARSRYPNFRRHFDAEPERKWQVEVVPALIRYAQMDEGWDSYSAPPLKRDAGLFALEILNSVMRPRTPLPQVVPSSVGGVQLEWHEKGVDLELHVTAPYEWELWFIDHMDPAAQPISLELTNDFSALERPITLLTSR